MSRFLKWHKRLKGKLLTIEAEALQGNLGTALMEFHKTGNLPLDKALRKEVLKIQEACSQMLATIPGPSPSGKLIPQNMR